MLTYAKTLIGIPYVAWTEGQSCLGNSGPFWAADASLPLPSREQLELEGACCTGFLNLLCREAGLTPPYVDRSYTWAGTTDAWWTLLNDAGVLKPYNPEQQYPVGTILLSPYEGPALEDQGHIGIIVEDGFMHSWLRDGISLDPSPLESHEWAQYRGVALLEDWTSVLTSKKPAPPCQS